MREREGEDGFEMFPPTVEGIMAFVQTTRPRPSRQAMMAHVENLRVRGILSDYDAEILSHRL